MSQARETEKITISEFRPEDIPLSCTWIVVGAPGSGKCLAPGTKVTMYDGSNKNVEDVEEGDALLGDDGTPRTVLGTCSGIDQMYLIRQSNGEDYIVNGPHILCLREADGGSSRVVEVSVQDYLSNVKKYQGLYGYQLDPCTLNIASYSEIEIQSMGEGLYFGFQIDGNGRFLLGDFTVTHNTTFMENMCYYLKHRYPVARLFIGTDGGYNRMCSIFHPLFVSNYYDEDEEKNHILRQRTCEKENGKTYEGNYAINILDDVSDDPAIYRTKIMRGLFKLGSQHWQQLLMVGSQYAIDMPPDVRKSVSYVAMFFEPEEIERKKLYTNFGGLAGSYETFCDLMDQLTGDYTCLVFKKRTQSHDVEDNVFYFKTKQLGDWKFGCDEYRKWANDRYDQSHVDEIVL